jgi:hypothetical protein
MVDNLQQHRMLPHLKQMPCERPINLARGNFKTRKKKEKKKTAERIPRRLDASCCEIASTDRRFQPAPD